jgi:hypothetical protein
VLLRRPFKWKSIKEAPHMSLTRKSFGAKLFQYLPCQNILCGIQVRSIPAYCTGIHKHIFILFILIYASAISWNTFFLYIANCIKSHVVSQMSITICSQHDYWTTTMLQSSSLSSVSCVLHKFLTDNSAKNHTTLNHMKQK